MIPEYFHRQKFILKRVSARHALGCLRLLLN
jgi:hypothetical protein